MIEGQNAMGMNRLNGSMIRGGMRGQARITMWGFGDYHTLDGLRSFDI